MKPSSILAKSSVLLFLVTANGACKRNNDSPIETPSRGIALDRQDMASVQQEVAKAIAAARPKQMAGTGLAGVMGGAIIKVGGAGAKEVIIPMPQLAENQVPVCYSIITIPEEAATEYRLINRDEENVVVSVKFGGGPAREIRIEWSAIVLQTGNVGSESIQVAQYLAETPCAQSNAEAVKLLAAKLWPDKVLVEAYAANIQEYIRSMKRSKAPRSLDALGILESGANSICTANANLAVALLRYQKIPARSLAVIPPLSQRLEMHRIVEYYYREQWVKFDPSSLQKEIPLKPWQNIVMAWSTIADEELAMQPRMGVTLGCPYGQEIELLDDGITLWGQDFFWTIGKPLDEFAVNHEVLTLAKQEWNRFLASGKLSQGQINAGQATSAAGLLEALKAD